MTSVAAGAILLTSVLDTAFAEPPTRFHPVAWFGRLVGVCDHSWRHPWLAGVIIAGVLPVMAAVVAGASIVLVNGLAPRPTTGSDMVLGSAAGFWLFVTTSRRMLIDVSRDVLDAVECDPERAKCSIRALVGRDTATLSIEELRSGAVESAAENLADGLVAPLLAFAIGAQFSIAAGVGAAVWVKAVNTLDSMLGYPHKPHGTPSARLDDAVMWLPARLSAVLLSIAAGNLAALRRAASWAHAPSSPNSGWPMATLATAVGVRLTKPGAYTLNGDAELPTSELAARGVRVVDRATILAFLFAGVISWF